MNKKALFLGFSIIIITYSLYSLFTYKDYGITSDEEVEYKSGRVLLDYYKTGNIPTNINLAERHYPENSMYFRGHLAISNILNPNFYYEQFHLINMLFALPIFIALYFFLYKEYENFYLAFLGPLFLFLTPRFFGHIPANPKDIPFGVFYFISLLCIYFSLKLPKLKPVNIIILGLIFGITQSFRSIGFTLHVILFLYYLTQVNITKKRFVKIFITSFMVLLTSIIVMVAIMPLLQKNILEGFKEIFINSQSYSYWNNEIIYFGEFLSKEERPSSYLPVWITITTPLFILIPFLLSPLVLLFKKFKKQAITLFLITILINFLGYFLLKPVIYNGLRHFLYLLPIVVVTSVIAIIEITKSSIDRKIVYPFVFLIAISIGFTIKDKISLYPYEYIYFNQIVGGLRGATNKFDTEYWGSSYKESATYVRDNLASEKFIKVYPCNVSFAVDYYSHKKFEIVNSKSEAEYIICDYDSTLTQDTPFEIIKTIERAGVPINYVGKILK